MEGSSWQLAPGLELKGEVCAQNHTCEPANTASCKEPDLAGSPTELPQPQICPFSQPRSLAMWRLGLCPISLTRLGVKGRFRNSIVHSGDVR